MRISSILNGKSGPRGWSRIAALNCLSKAQNLFAYILNESLCIIRFLSSRPQVLREQTQTLILQTPTCQPLQCQCLYLGAKHSAVMLDAIAREVVMFLLGAYDRADAADQCQGTTLRRVQEDLDYAMIVLGHFRGKYNQPARITA